MEQTRNTCNISVFVVNGKIIITKQGVRQCTGLKRLGQVPIGSLYVHLKVQNFRVVELTAGCEEKRIKSQSAPRDFCFAFRPYIVTNLTL
jgi:hypothetical protein